MDMDIIDHRESHARLIRITAIARLFVQTLFNKDSGVKITHETIHAFTLPDDLITQFLQTPKNPAIRSDGRKNNVDVTVNVPTTFTGMLHDEPIPKTYTLWQGNGLRIKLEHLAKTAIFDGYLTSLDIDFFANTAIFRFENTQNGDKTAIQFGHKLYAETILNDPDLVDKQREFEELHRIPLGQQVPYYYGKWSFSTQQKRDEFKRCATSVEAFIETMYATLAEKTEEGFRGWDEHIYIPYMKRQVLAHGIQLDHEDPAEIRKHAVHGANFFCFLWNMADEAAQ